MGYDAVAMDALAEVIQRTWGYSQLRPLQREAMEASLHGRDALVVMPTGGGKSLCYQAPALCAEGLTVVVSPLISLMKDQVDGLIERGVPSAFLNSSLEPNDRYRVQGALARGEYRLLFIAPERFASAGFEKILGMAKVRAFAIDEAHCISHWGHDFRADYRDLGKLKKLFPGVPVHAFTATATPRVRDDIVDQLGLQDPAVLVGDFFRPNLRFRVVRRTDALSDSLAIIKERGGQAGIVYCIRRSDVDELARDLRDAGVRAVGYHAGMQDALRTRAQDRWIHGEVDVVVATVAFGMGIDRPDVRFVLHTAMPQTLEHYQQETGRAGRDGQPSDCILFWSGQDYSVWRSILTEEPNKMRLLGEMYGYCTGQRCRHRALVEYFGQSWTRGPCGACDTCERTEPPRADSAGLAKTILAAIARTGQRYGAAYVAEILAGEATDRVKERGHEKAADFGALKAQKRDISLWIRQLADAGHLRVEGEYGVLKLTPTGAAVLRGEAEAPLYGESPAPKKRRRKTKEVPEGQAGPEETALYERLREIRRKLANERNVPAFMILSDASLRALARLRPGSPEALLLVPGIGPWKAEAYGERFLEAIRLL